MKSMRFSNRIGYKGILFFVLLLTTEIAFCQMDPSDDPVARTLPRTISPAGDAATLGRYCEYPIDISTGVPSIQIPIYNIKVNDIELPISISYHASGNKVDDISSVVGLGWALNAGGCISRTVKSEADNDPINHEYLTREQIDNNPLSNRNCILYSLESHKNLESDIYSYSFNGHQGQFRYDSDNKLVLSTYEDIKISGGPATGYSIYTADGTKYIFSDGDEVRTMSKTYKNSWYLNQIITSNSDTITLTYNYYQLNKSDRSISFMCNASSINYWQFISYTDNLKIQYLDNIKFKNGGVKFNYLSDRKDMRNMRLTSIDVLDYKAAIIKKINLAQTYFISEGLPSDITKVEEFRYYYRLKLDNVNIVNPINSFDNQLYRFEYNETKLPPYFFTTYFTPRSYYSQDYWGYYNGALNFHLIPVASPCGGDPANRSSNGYYMQACVLNKIFYPTGGRTEYEYQPNTSRGNITPVGGLRVSAIKGFADNLSTTPSLVKSYTYDNGGWTSNWWSDMMVDKWRFVNLADGVTATYSSTPIGPTTFCGGPIVMYSTVNEYSGTNMQTKTEYNYEVETELQYSVNSSLDNCFPAGRELVIYLHGSGPQLDHHRFTHYWKDNSWRSGQLSSRIIYKNVNGGYEPVEEVHNTWAPYLVKDNIVGLVLVPLHPNNYSCSPSGNPDCMYQYFNILTETGVKKLKKTSEKLYTDNGIVEKTTDYEYEKLENPQVHGFITKMSFPDNAGIIQTRTYKYPLDYPSTTSTNACEATRQACLTAAATKRDQMLAQCNQISDASARATCTGHYTSTYDYEVAQCQNNYNNCALSDQQIITEMQNKNMINVVIEEQNSQTKNSIKTLTGGIVNIYRKENNLIVPSEKYSLEINNPSSDLTASSINASGALVFHPNYSKKLTYDKYDAKGNTLQYHLSDNISTCFIWSYNGSMPVAKGDNVTYDILNAAVIAAGATNIETFWSGFNNIATDAALQTTWKNFNTALRSNASLANAQVTTYTYSPLVGMTSQTDSNGITTYYEYDGFGRLKNVRDKDQNILKHKYYHYYSSTSSDSPTPVIQSTLSSNPNGLTFGSLSDVQDVAISSNTTWTATKSQSWITLVGTSGTGNSSIGIRVSKLISGTRIGYVTLQTSDGKVSIQIEVYQDSSL